MRGEQQLDVALKENHDLKVAFNEHAIVVMTDPRGKITYVNDKFCAISQYSRQELLGQDHRIINSGHHSKDFMRDLWTTLGQGKVWKGEIKNKAKDGSYYWVDSTIVPFLNPEGKPRHYVAIRADITARKKAEIAMAHLAGIVNSSDDAIISKDLDSIILTWNRGAEKTFGYAAGEMEGTSIMRLIPVDRWEEEKQILDTIKRGDRVEHFETIRQTKDGRLIDVSVTASPIIDSSNKIIAVSKVARDITERKQARERIHQLNSQLEQRVIERTAQLEAANKELDAFSYSVSHDLRSPLRAVDGFSQAVLEDYGPLLPEACREDLKTIRAGAQKMGELIDDLLAFARLSRLPLNKSSVDTREMVLGALEELQHQKEGRRVEVRIDDLPACQADPAMLKQVWINLLSNALKYTGKCESPLVAVESQRQNGQTVFLVRDNGTGFDMKYSKKLFGVFQRLHRSEDYEGTGVGLAIVQRVIHRHRGRVWAEAVKDRGATFYFTLEGEAKS